jgi:hypothetical protein
MNNSCNSPCYDLRPHADPKYVVCVKCNEIYLKNEKDLADQARYENEVGLPWNPMDMSINEEYEYEKQGGFDHMST